MGQKEFFALYELFTSFHATDVGDFKRKAVTAINRYLEKEEDKELVKKAKKMKDFIVCYNDLTSSHEVDDFRNALLQQIKS